VSLELNETPCPQGSTCAAAIEYTTPFGIDLDSIARYCSQEACGVNEIGVGFSGTVDFWSGAIDVIRIGCPGLPLVQLLSNGNVVLPDGTLGDPQQGTGGVCWDCFEDSGCGGENCPVGHLCLTLPGSTGSDCRAFGCPTGYRPLVGGSSTYLPTCPNIPVPATSATLFEGLPKLAWSGLAGAGITDYVVYRQVETMAVWAVVDTVVATSFVDNSASVTGGPTAVQPQGAWVRYHVRSIYPKYGESLAGTTHYFPREGPTPPTAPAAPATTATTLHDSPKITWTAVTNATEYRVYRQTNVMSDWELAFTVGDVIYLDPSTAVTGVPQSGPPSGPWVRYRVTSVGATGLESLPGPTHYYQWAGGGGPS
jgi:hypothetical protein